MNEYIVYINTYVNVVKAKELTNVRKDSPSTPHNIHPFCPALQSSTIIDTTIIIRSLLQEDR